MVAELLRLRLRILANGFRRPAPQVVGLVIGILLALGGVAAIWFGAGWLAQWGDRYALRVVPVIGSWLTIAAILIPIMVVRRSVMSPRAFLGYPISSVGVALTLLAFLLIGPGILIVPVAIAPTRVWQDDASMQIAWAAAPILLVQALLAIQLARHLGQALRKRPLLAAWVDFSSVIVLVLGAVVVIITLAPRIPVLEPVLRAQRPFASFLAQIPEWAAASPLGAMWAAPGVASSVVDDPDAAWRTLGFGLLAVVVLLVAWIALIGSELSPTRKLPGPRRTRVPGWFASLPTTPAGAIAARAATYWMRDPRYRAVFAVLPLLPILILLSFWVGGIPFAIAVIVPLPLMTLILAWSTVHNDVAYDGTAVWQHIVADTEGVHDRAGRAVPPLLWGLLLLAIGVPLTVWAAGDIDLAPPLLGVCLALLFGGVGIGSLYSARFPYAAPRPGDPAWQSPQTATTQGGVAQSISIGLVLLVSVPAFAAATVWWIEGGRWGWVALVAGIVMGLLVLWLGIRGGGRSFERRGPELLAFTQRN